MKKLSSKKKYNFLKTVFVIKGSKKSSRKGEILPKYEKFMKDQLINDYEFKLGIQFNLFSDFKDATIE